jgi:hypothetical protein
MSAANPAEWVWMGHSGHFILGHECQFHLATYLGNGYLVSTVGEYRPDSKIREVLARARESKEPEPEFEEVGYKRLYETMVFRATPSKDPSVCCPWRMAYGDELDMNGYNKPVEAEAGHYAMCRKWAKEKPAEIGGAT